MRKIIVPFLLMCLLAIVLLVLYVIWSSGGYFQQAPLPSTIPTAEYLEQNPIPLPAFVRDITPPPGSIISSSERICSTILPGAVSSSSIRDGSDNAITENVARNTRVAVNGVRAARQDIEISILAILDQLPDGRLTGRITVCFEPNLQTGIHIVELQTGDSFWGLFGIGTTVSYTWSYRVE
jgi:hypothetical protein